MSVHRILLINPPGKCSIRKDGSLAERKHCTPPLGLAYLAANLLKHGYQVEVIDILAEGYMNEIHQDSCMLYGLSTEETLARVQNAKPDIVGMSVMFSSRAKEAFELCARIKQILPNVPIVVGGATCYRYAGGISFPPRG